MTSDITNLAHRTLSRAAPTLRPIRTGLLSAVLMLTALGAAGCQSIAQPSSPLTVSTVEPDERVVLFRSAAHLDPDTGNWQIPLQAWVYETKPRGATKWAVQELLDSLYDVQIAPEQQANFEARAELLFADSESGEALVVRVGDQQFELPRTGLNGLSSSVAQVPLGQLLLNNIEGLELEVVLAEGDARRITSVAIPEPPGSRVIISDLDDTIKITGAMEKASLYRNTFAEDFAAVPGMAEVYQQWHRQGWLLHIVSSSPEQLYEPLDAFMQTEGFPVAVLHFKSFRFGDRSVGNLVRSGLVTKPPAIGDIIEACAGCRFLLIGDTGQEDPEAYSAIVARYPERIVAVAFRNVRGDSLDSERYRDLLAALGPSRCLLFDDPADIARLGELQ